MIKFLLSSRFVTSYSKRLQLLIFHHFLFHSTQNNWKNDDNKNNYPSLELKLWFDLFVATTRKTPLKKLTVTVRQLTDNENSDPTDQIFY